MSIPFLGRVCKRNDTPFYPDDILKLSICAIDILHSVLENGLNLIIPRSRSNSQKHDPVARHLPV